MAREQYIKTKKDSIYYYKDSNGKKLFAYRYKYLDWNKKRCETTKRGFQSEREAERALVEVKADILDGNILFVQETNTNLSQWMTRYSELRSKRWKVSTKQHYYETITNHINPLIGHYKLNQLTNNIIQEEFVDVLVAKKLKKVTIRGIISVLHAALAFAVLKELIKRNPITELEYDDAGEARTGNFYTEEELNQFLQCAKDNDPHTRYSLLLTLAMTGMRKGEALALTWEDIDFENKLISVSKTRDRFGSRKPKTKRSVRTLHMNDTLAIQLKKYQSWCIQKKWKLKMQHQKEDVVFITVKGARPPGDSYLKDTISFICTKYELKRISPHGLRHTFASILLANNIPLISVAEILGDHPNTVLAVYAHSLVKKETQAADLIQSFVN